jgi:hypothetical protein
MIHADVNVLVYALRKDVPLEMARAGCAGALTQGYGTTGGRVERRASALRVN